MRLLMRWIQISDVHFQTKVKSFNTGQLRSKLPEYLLKIKNETGDIDALIITGDYRYAPEGEVNTTYVYNYILKLANSISVACDNIVTVPGNHDLTRSSVRKAVIKEIRSDYSPNIGTIEIEMLTSLQNDFSFYHTLQQQLNNSLNWKSNPHIIVELENCNLLLLNTALTAGAGDDDENKLLIGSSYLDAAVANIKNRKPIIAVGHHGLDFIEREEKKLCTNYFDQKNIRLYLCGHSHDITFSSFGDKIKQANCGCLIQDDKTVYAGINVGELYDDGTVKIQCHKWESSINDWVIDSAHSRQYDNLYDCNQPNNEDEDTIISKTENDFSICGYQLLAGLGSDGIKYIWKKKEYYVESLAFNRRLKMESENPNDRITSAYTISTSIGCNLSTSGQQCKFCETGTNKFHGYLKAEEIALQCIFMAKYDSNCTSYPQLKDNMREFAFMGQGEPCYNYLAIKQAILLTDYVMEKIDQKVSRYIISTCGITEFMPSLITDIKNNVFRNRITVHFSLHTIGEERNELMPINKDHNYSEFIKYCRILHQVSGEKIGVGILMFNKYKLTNSEEKKYTLTKDKLDEILSLLDKDAFRIDLCTVNSTSTGSNHKLSMEIANELLEFVKSKGYEGKIFTSFGDSELSGCGMLSSSIEKMEDAGNKTIQQFNLSIDLLREAQEYLEATLLN